MKMIRRIAATLALCGTAFFTNMAHAGDCGYWETQGFWSTSNVEILGSGGVPPATGPGTSTFITTGATFVAQSCGGPPDNGNVGVIVPSKVDCARQQAISTRACEKDEKQGTALCAIAQILGVAGIVAQAVCVYLVVEEASRCLDRAQKGADRCNELNNQT